MNRTLKTILILAACLIAAGLIVFAAAYFISGGDLSKLQPADYKEVTYPIEGEFSNVDIDVDISGIEFRISEDGSAKAVCFETEKHPHRVTVEDGTLHIVCRYSSSFADNVMNWGVFQAPRVTVYLPNAELNKLTIQTDTGKAAIPSGVSVSDVSVKGDTGRVTIGAIEAKTISIALSTGDITIDGAKTGVLTAGCTTGSIVLMNIEAAEGVLAQTDTGAIAITGLTAETLHASTDTGAVGLKDTEISLSMKIATDTGMVVLDRCGAGSMEITTDTGSVRGTLTTRMSFDARSSTGSVRVPESDPSGGSAKITTDTGSIKIEYAE